jgi:hypothetical protein
MAKHAGDGQLGKLSEKGTPNEEPQIIMDELFADRGFFDPLDIAQVKYEMLRRVANGQSVADAIRAFGFSSHHSFYKAQAAFKQSGLAGLVPVKRGPKKNSAPSAVKKLRSSAVGRVLSHIEENRQNIEPARVNKFVSEHLEIDFVMRRVRVGNNSIRLTPKEYDLLRCLVSQAGKPVPHRELLLAVWGPDSVDQIDYLRVFITYLRKKIEPDPANPQYILTEPWVGYRFLGFDE